MTFSDDETATLRPGWQVEGAAVAGEGRRPPPTIPKRIRDDFTWKRIHV